MESATLRNCLIKQTKLYLWVSTAWRSFSCIKKSTLTGMPLRKRKRTLRALAGRECWYGVCDSYMSSSLLR